jgi:hypothetical protein
MWAECGIPLTAVEPSNLKLETNRNGKTPYGKLKYSDSILQLDPFTIVTPSFPMVKYDTVKGRMDFELGDDTISLKKFQSIQDSLYTLLHQQQYEWFHSNTMSFDDIKGQFQPFIQGSVLSIYLSTLLRSGKPIWVWNGSKWSTSIQPNMFVAGQNIRLVLRLTGVQSFQSTMNPNAKYLKCHIVMHPIAILIRS